jgi:predicted Holliday junction resolvase-like endonuclease
MAAMSAFGVGGATARAGAAPPSSIEQKLEHMQRDIENLYTTTRNLDTRIKEEATAKADAIKTLKEETERKQQELWERITSIATGGIRLETVGLVWVATGSILPAFPHLAYVLWPLV